MNIRIIDEVEFGTKAWERTNGHPQIAQFLGDRLVRLLDERADRRELSLGAEEIGQVTDTYEFAEHYLNTYWGQANPLEKSISLLVGDKTMSAADIGSALLWQGSRPTDNELMSALRMLQLFGILKAGADGFSLRAEWFPSALAHFGGVTVEANELVLETVFSLLMHLQGPVPLGHESYIERPFELKLIRELQAGRWVLFLGPRQHGKTSALVVCGRP